MILYHGSKDIIEKPIYGQGKKYNDYGLGFYCTDNIELAKEWGTSFERSGYANRYQIDCTELKILDLNDDKYCILHWLAILLSNREFDTPAGLALEAMEKAKQKGVKLLLPVDTKVGKEFKPDTESKTVAWTDIPDGWEGFDIGEKTIEMFKNELKNAKTVIWNGPVGLFEFDQFAIGTNEIAKTLADLDATTIIGGGDSGAAVAKAGLADKMTHICTGGGASLEFLEGKKLPGIECLLDK